MGRRPKLTPHQRQEAIKRRDRDEETLADIGRSYNVSPATISRLQLMDGFEFNPDVDENDAKALRQGGQRLRYSRELYPIRIFRLADRSLGD